MLVGYVPTEIDSALTCFPRCVRYISNISDPLFCTVVNANSNLYCECEGSNSSALLLTKGIVCEPEVNSIYLLALELYCLVLVAAFLVVVRNLGCSGCSGNCGSKGSLIRSLYAVYGCVMLICLSRIAQLVPRLDAQHVYPDEVKAALYVFPQLLQLPLVYFTLACRVRPILTKPYSFPFLLKLSSLLYLGGCVVSVLMFLEGSRDWLSQAANIGLGSVKLSFIVIFGYILYIERSYYVKKKRHLPEYKTFVILCILVAFFLQTPCVFVGFLSDSFLFPSTVSLYVVDCLFLVLVLHVNHQDSRRYKQNVKILLKERRENKRPPFEKKWKVRSALLSPPSPENDQKVAKRSMLSVDEWFGRYLLFTDEEDDLFTVEDMQRFSLESLVVLLPLIATDSLCNKQLGSQLRQRIDNESQVNEIVQRFLLQSPFDKWLVEPRGNVCHPFYPTRMMYRRKCIHKFMHEKQPQSVLMCVCSVSEAPCTFLIHTCKKTSCFTVREKCDVYNDIVCLLLQRAMNSMWKAEKNARFSHVKTHVYKCMRLSVNSGCVEFVKNSRPLSVLLSDKNRDIRLPQNMKQSAAAFFVSAYVLGLHNRNDDNIMVTNEDCVFTVNFDSILGDLCSFETSDFPLTSAFVHKLKTDSLGNNNSSSGRQNSGGGNSMSGKEQWEEFEEMCEWAYGVLRQTTNREKLTRIAQALFPEYCHPFLSSFFATRLQRDVANDYAQMGFRNKLRLTFHSQLAHATRKCQFKCCRRKVQLPVGPLFWEATDGFLEEDEMKSEKAPKKPRPQTEKLLPVPLASSSSASPISTPTSLPRSATPPLVSTPGRRSTAFPPPPEDSVIELLAVRDHKDYLMMEDFGERRRASSALPPPPSPDKHSRIL